MGANFINLNLNYTILIVLLFNYIINFNGLIMVTLFAIAISSKHMVNESLFVFNIFTNL